MSVWVVLSPSLHISVLAFGMAGHDAVPLGVPAVWHWFGVSQTTVVPTQVPEPLHMLVWVVLSPSLHISVLAFGTAGHDAVPLGVPAVWHWFGVSHTTVVPTQAPEPLHMSVWVVLSPSLHISVLAFGTAGHDAVPLGVPAVWHWFGVSQTTVEPEHPPLPSHTSPNVVRLLSLHPSPALFRVGSQVELPFGVPGF